MASDAVQQQQQRDQKVHVLAASAVPTMILADAKCRRH
jgi:hypothetical protein